ncbi:MAG: cytochrome C554 [Pirellulaceae bacterium]
MEEHAPRETFEELHRMPEAKAIAEPHGLLERQTWRTLPRMPLHGSGPRGQAQANRWRVVRSCHGASSDWITVHNDYGGPGVSREDESAAHARQRREQSIAAGMRNPRNLYSVAQSCFGCHSIRREDLINHGGHQLASTDFELVAWSQGRVRHNFLRTNNVSNEPSPPERLRVMYVVGVLADLEYATRATAVATTVGPYGVASAQRAADRALKLKAIQEAVQDPLLQEVLTTFAEAELVTNNAEQLLAVAERISELGSEFAEKRDGSTLGAIDAWLPSPANYR